MESKNVDKALESLRNLIWDEMTEYLKTKESNRVKIDVEFWNDPDDDRVICDNVKEIYLTEDGYLQVKGYLFDGKDEEKYDDEDIALYSTDQLLEMFKAM